VDDVIFDANSGGKFTATVDTAQTVNSITITPSSGAGVLTIALIAKLTTNALTTTGTAGNNRIVFRGNTTGIAIDFSINGAVSISDCDFSDVYVIGSSSPISGTRLGNRQGTSGITFSSPKTVYWATTAGGSWSGNNWAASAGGAVNTDNFPLPQDTATIVNTGLNTSATVTVDSLFAAISGINMSGRTNAMTLSIGSTFTVYGDWTNGSGTTISGASAITFGGRNTQTITSAGKSFSCPIIVSSYGGTVQLADALNIGSNTLTITNGTFTTNNYAITAGVLSSSNSNVRAINLGASTVTVSSTTPVIFTTPTNLTFNAGTSQITCSSTTGNTFNGGGQTFYNVSAIGLSSGTVSTAGSNTFNNLTLTAGASSGIYAFAFSADQTINSTLTCAGASPIRRVSLQSDTLGTTRTLTVNSLSATDCDFRDITIAGAAAGSSPTRAGDRGGNSGITFPFLKTVYWNLAGSQNWSATGWCPSSGGTPDINQFPLAQDTAVFDDTGSAGTVTVDAVWSVGTVNLSARTSAMTLSVSNIINVYGNWTNGSGATISGASSISFVGRSVQTITSGGTSFAAPISLASIGSTVQLADALTTSSTLTLNTGTFDAVSYNVTTSSFSSVAGSITKMGSGTWTLSGTGTVWSMLGTLYKNTADIVLSNTSTTARTFAGNAAVYNKLTIGGTTGISTLAMSGNNVFSELASTKTVAHTIALGTTSPTFGAWTVTGTAGNVVTVTGTATIVLIGARVSGVDYLALGTTTLSASSPPEFYAGANSTGGTNFILTVAPAPVTRYWRGGSGTWDLTTTTNWSATSGGAGNASVPTSVDTVIFNSASNATSYTVTCTGTLLRCGALTFSGPTSGTLSLSGSANLAIFGNFVISGTGVSWGLSTGYIDFCGNTAGKTITTNGVTITNLVQIFGLGSNWLLGSAFNNSTNNINIVVGGFSSGGYSVTSASLNSPYNNQRSIDLGSSTVTLSGSTPIGFGTSEANRANFSFNAGTSTITSSGSSATFNGNNQSFYNFSFSGATQLTVSGANTFNNFTSSAPSSVGYKSILFNDNQTINGTLTCSAGTNATYRTAIRSGTFATPISLTVNAFSGTDVNFGDINITGAAAPISGTRLGDEKGNSGITFDAPKTVYWNLAGGGSWNSTAWATSSGGTPAVNNFPLAQDTAVFQSTGLNSGASIAISGANWYIGTIDMSARTSNTMTLSLSVGISCVGNWINGAGVTNVGTSAITFVGRTAQTITSAGRPFANKLIINSPGGTVTLQDALAVSYTSSTGALTVTSGTFNANNYNVSLTGSTSTFLSSYSSTRAIAIGSGTWTIAGSGTAWDCTTSTGLTVTGTGTISLTSASAKTFAGGGISYSGTTLNQGGAGSLTLNDSNTFYDITNTYSATGAATIALGSTYQTLSQFTGTGASGRVLSITGTSAASPGTLILNSSFRVTAPDYLSLSNVRAFPVSNTWYAGANSTNLGSYGWIFSAGAVTLVGLISESASGVDSISGGFIFTSLIDENSSGIESVSGGFNFNGVIDEVASGLDLQSVIGTLTVNILETGAGLDEVFNVINFSLSVYETGSIQDQIDTTVNFNILVSELSSGLDEVFPTGSFSISVSESAAGSDSAFSLTITNNSVSEAASGLDNVTPSITFNLSVSEIASGLEALVPTTFMTALINEVASALESSGNIGTFNIAVTEAAAGQDQPSNIGTFNIAVTEASTGTVVFSARLLWEPIDDQQTANWATIGTTQTANWATISTGQTPNWQDI